MNDTVRDLLELAARLEHVRSLPPGPLIRREPRARDGPPRAPDALRRKGSRHGPPGAPQRVSAFNWKSKGF
jgi:hypothetical protein